VARRGEEGGRAVLEGIAARLRDEGIRVRTLLDERPPADAILHVATREEVDLIVMSTHGRGGFSVS